MKKKDVLFWIVAIVISLIPVGVILAKVWTGAFPFWYDPARDLLSAWDNFSKPTLIGPPSGIPGIFYGPYWIWMLSIGEFFSHDPRVVDFIAMTIPYVIFFPVLLFLFKKVFDRKVSFLLWMLFILGYGSYAYSLWNPNPAPLLFLLFVLLLFISDFDTYNRNQELWIVMAGFSLGVLVNFHLSFGIGIVCGTVIYWIISTLLEYKKKRYFFFINRTVNGLVLTFGFLVAFSPFFLFEIRHNFNQTKTFINAFTHFGAVVHLTGLSHVQILSAFFGRLATLLQLPLLFSSGLFILAILYLLFQWKQKRTIFSPNEKKLIILLVSMTAGVLGIYLSAKNPIWSYHFIAVEIIFLLSLGVILQKIKILQVLTGIWTLYLLIIFSLSSIQSFSVNQGTVSVSPIAEEGIVKKIHVDAGEHAYAVFVYSPSIYSYEYSYLFRYLYNKKVPYRPELNPTDSNIVYLVFPPQVKQSVHNDFVHYRTPDNQYKTIQQWTMSSGSTIIKRERKP